MLKVLTIDSEYDSACRLGFPTHTYLPEKASEQDRHIIWRHGNSLYHFDSEGKPTEFKHVINPFTSIRLNVNKPEALKRMGMYVLTPKLYLKEVPKNKLVVVRPFNHSHGRDFQVKKGPFVVPEQHYATEFIKTRVEYRIWYVKDNFLCAKRVAPKNHIKQEFECRSEFLYKFCKMPAKLGRLVRMSAQMLGLESGAADVLRIKRKFFFCEHNSSPSIDARRIREFYQRHVPNLAREKFPNMEVQPPNLPTRRPLTRRA